MQRLRTSILAVLLAGATLGQPASQLSSEAVRRVGSRLACLCGCNDTVASCQMLECHYASPARKRIAELQAAGRSDDEIVAEFVQKSGKQALSAPPAEGFHLLAWVMPFVAIAAGLGMIWLFIQRFRKPLPASNALADTATFSHYQEQIERDLKKLD